jgi:hypothetical protein
VMAILTIGSALAPLDSLIAQPGPFSRDARQRSYCVRKITPLRCQRPRSVVPLAPLK